MYKCSWLNEPITLILKVGQDIPSFPKNVHVSRIIQLCWSGLASKLKLACIIFSLLLGIHLGTSSWFSDIVLKHVSKRKFVHLCLNDNPELGSWDTLTRDKLRFGNELPPLPTNKLDKFLLTRSPLPSANRAVHANLAILSLCSSHSKIIVV